jgi:hypothetical protein
MRAREVGRSAIALAAQTAALAAQTAAFVAVPRAIGREPTPLGRPIAKPDRNRRPSATADEPVSEKSASSASRRSISH